MGEIKKEYWRLF